MFAALPPEKTTMPVREPRVVGVRVPEEEEEVVDPSWDSEGVVGGLRAGVWWPPFG